MSPRTRLAALVALAGTLAFGAVRAGAEQQADPGVDCALSIEKDGKSWNRQGTGWIRTVPGPNGSTDSFSMANYQSNTPVQTKTLNCSTGQWDTPPL